MNRTGTRAQLMLEEQQKLIDDRQYSQMCAMRDELVERIGAEAYNNMIDALPDDVSMAGILEAQALELYLLDGYSDTRMYGELRHG